MSYFQREPLEGVQLLGSFQCPGDAVPAARSSAPLLCQDLQLQQVLQQ